MSTNEDENQAQEEMEIEALNEGSGAPAQCSIPTKFGHSSNKRKERSLASAAGNQPKKKAQQD